MRTVLLSLVFLYPFCCRHCCPPQEHSVVTKHSVTQATPKAELPLRFSVYKDTKGEWRWRLQAANNRIIADSGEGYKNKADCLHGISLIRDKAPISIVVEK